MFNLEPSFVGTTKDKFLNKFITLLSIRWMLFWAVHFELVQVTRLESEGLTAGICGKNRETDWLSRASHSSAMAPSGVTVHGHSRLLITSALLTAGRA